MKVAKIVEESRVGGPQVRMVRVASALRSGVEPVIVSPEKDSQGLRDLCGRNDVNYISVKLTPPARGAGGLIMYALSLIPDLHRILALLRRERVDLVHACGGSWQVKGLLAARVLGIPIVWHLNDTSMPRIVRESYKVLRRLPDAYIFASERSRSYYAALGLTDRPGAVIPAPVDSIQFDPDEAYAGDSEILDELSGKLVVGTVANVSPVKGLETLVRAARELRDRQCDVTIVIVGVVGGTQQAYTKYLEAMISEFAIDSVKFVGPRDDVRALMQRFDIYLCTSNAESSPVAVWEAMAMSKPIVSTDVGDVPVHVNSGEMGFIVPVGDYRAVAERISELASSEEMRNRFGAACRTYASERFATAAIARQTADFYERVLSSAR